MSVLLIVAALAGLYMAWAIGANDVANAMGTSVGSGALTLRKAVIVAAIFEFLGAVLAGGKVTGTMRGGIVELSAFAGDPQIFVYGMISALLAAAVWLNVASRFGWPVSTTHSIVGAIIGFGVVSAGVDAVQWGGVGQIALSWVTSPVAAGLMAFGVFKVVQRVIFTAQDPWERARATGPLFAFATTVVLSLVTLWKGLKHLKLDVSKPMALGLSVALGVIAAIAAAALLRRVQKPEDSEDDFAGVERLFAVLQVFTACAVAFAHGSNDVANAIGPMAGAVEALRTGALSDKSPVPLWMLLIGGTGIVVGLATYGYQVMATIGTKITHLTPSRGYAAEFAAALVIVLASQWKMPISTTHTLVGAVLGVGLARGLSATNPAMLGQIAVSWIVTLPAGAILAVLFFWVLRAAFG